MTTKAAKPASPATAKRTPPALTLAIPASPDPETIKATREAAGISQTEAGALVYAALRSWQHWENGDRAMSPAIWELFTLKLPLAKRAAA